MRQWFIRFVVEVYLISMLNVVSCLGIYTYISHNLLYNMIS